MSSAKPAQKSKSVLTVAEVADLLKVCRRTVMNMARRGDIPGKKIGHLWRFDEEAVLDWLRIRSQGGNGSDRAPSAVAPAPAESVAAPVMERLRPELVRIEAGELHRREVLEDLASLAMRSGLIADYAALLKSLKEREDMVSTAVNDGVAFPHPRRPLEELEEPVLAALSVTSGVDFNAPEGSDTHLFILFCAPDDVTHVRILARLARVFHKKKRLIAKLKRIRSPRKFVEELILAEREIIHSRD